MLLPEKRKCKEKKIQRSFKVFALWNNFFTADVSISPVFINISSKGKGQTYIYMFQPD
jgi:hypothetical protein